MTLPVFKWTSAFALLSVSLVPCLPVSAATVTAANDYVTDLEAGQLSNHEIVFTTPSGVSEGETITFSFDTDFDTSTIVENDVDIEDDGADLTTAVDCTGAEQTGVAMVADVLTITVCAGDGGAIAAGSEVAVKIGTNATGSGTGSNQIENPADIGTYFLNLSGTFGDSGSIALPIGGDISFNVIAEVTGAGGGGGGGGGGEPPPSDISAPIIRNIVVSNISGTTATISWDTDEPADGHIDYGVTTGYGSVKGEEAGYITIHSVTLTNLNGGTTYHFRIRTADISNNQTTTGDYTFTTSDTTPPVLSSIQAVDLTTTSARITWNTDENANSKVDYGLTTGYGGLASDAAFVTSHSLLLTGLNSGTAYHFRVRSEDVLLNKATSSDLTFTTVANPPPANVSNLTVTAGDAQNSLSWSNPADADLSGVRINVCTDEAPTAPNDPTCVVVFEGTGTGYTHTGLTNDTTYYYGVYAVDTSGQFASGALGTGTPRAPEEELPAEELPPEVPPAPAEVPEGPPAPVPGAPSGAVCGDGVCSDIESSEGLCPIDCAPERPLGPTCGNAVCEEGEDTQSCPDDCGPGLVPAGVLQGDLEFFVASGAISLQPTGSGVVRVIAGTVVRVQLLARNVSKVIESVQFVVGSETFLMAPNFGEGQGEADLRSAAIDDPAYVVSFTVGEPATYPGTVTLKYSDDTSQSVSIAFEAVGPGILFAVSEGTVFPISGGIVTLLLAGDGLETWDGSPYAQFNPVTTASGGRFAWYVPNGSYVVRAAAEGYESTERNVAVDDHIVNPSIQMAAIPGPIVVPEEEKPPAVPFLPPEVSAVIQAVGKQVEQIQQTIVEIREVPGVQESAQVAVPVLAVSAAASSMVLVFAFDLVPFLQYLFTAPVLFLGRRKRRGFGVVYNAISKTPVDLAVVRLFELPAGATADMQGRLIASRVTDRGGHYYFSAKPGQYRLSVQKAGYTYPTDYLREQRVDGDYLDLYHGEPIVVTDRHAVIAANVPVDPSQAAEYRTPAAFLWKARLRVIQNLVAGIGVVLSAVVATLRPSTITYAMIGVQIIVLVLVKKLAAARKPKSWGIVYDQHTRQPIANVIARVFEPKYNKLLDTAVTDAKGRYSFVLGPNEYFAVFEKPGFVSLEVRPIDYTSAKGPTEFGQKVSLLRQIM